MYLISIYFDEKTEKRIRQFIKMIADVTTNLYMIDAAVPPHITVSAFECRKEKELEVLQVLDRLFKGTVSGDLQWVSTGQFMPGVIFASVVLNEYLHKLSADIYDNIKQIDELLVSGYYRPYQWFPHTTLAKKLEKEEMKKAFGVLQDYFGMFQGKAVRIGLARTNPYRDIAVWDLL